MIFAPERFSDWYAHLTNQGSHGGLVGVGMALILYPVLPPILAWMAVVAVYFAYEAIVQFDLTVDWEHDWDWRDSVDDTANVAGGAAVLIGALAWGYWAALGGFAVWGASLGLSVWRRV